MNDELTFTPEEEIKSTVAVADPWNILVIDDDMEVHVMTKLALKNVKIYGRGLNLVHAYTGIDGMAYLKEMKEIDLILLDMVMETHDAGLEVARWLREEEGRHDRPVIILRTGHPGLLTTQDVLLNEHFNGMIEKSNVTYHNLINLLTRMLPGTPSDN
jgi:CheY-like chemotaxis protein